MGSPEPRTWRSAVSRGEAPSSGRRTSAPRSRTRTWLSPRTPSRLPAVEDSESSGWLALTNSTNMSDVMKCLGRRAGCASAFLILVAVGCQLGGDHPDSTEGEPLDRVRQSYASPVTVDIQGIGSPYGGWVALNEDGSVWMNRPGGDVGVNTAPMKVESLGNDVELIANVDGESGTYCVVKTDHSLWCWGTSTHGQVGDGSGAPSVAEPTHIAIPGDHVVSVGTGGEHACAVTMEGRLYCWGMNLYGQLGDGMPNGTVDVLDPVEVTALGDQVKKVSTGFEHTCALMKDDSVYCWGHNTYGEIGDGTAGEYNDADRVKPVPVPVTAVGTDVAVLSAGGFFTCIITKSDASLWCWGDNTEGHLAVGDINNRATPTKSVDPGPWLDVDTGVVLGCGLKTDGSAWCWGRHELGGLGTTTPDAEVCISAPCSDYPQAVEGLTSGGKLMSVKHHGVCVVMDDGGLMCWGAGNFLDATGGSEVAQVVDYSGFCEAADCTGATPVCGVDGACVACTEDGECPAATPACLASGECGQCSATNTTACSEPADMCDTTTNTCVGCVTDEDCAYTTTPICDDATKLCRGCTSDADCTAAAPACQPSGLCGECSSTNLTLCVAPLAACEPESGTCVNCNTDTDCTGSGDHCDTASHTCVGGDGGSGGGEGDSGLSGTSEIGNKRYGACARIAPGTEREDWRLTIVLGALVWVLRRRRK